MTIYLLWTLVWSLALWFCFKECTMFVSASFTRISLTCLSLFVLCPNICLYNLCAIYFFWVICYTIAVTIDQLVCLSSFSPGSDHGSLFSLVCGWSEIWTVCFLPVLWLCVASSIELWQRHSSVVPPMGHAKVFFGPRLPEANLGSSLHAGFVGSAQFFTCAIFIHFWMLCL